MEGWFNLPGTDRPFINGWHIESGNEQNIKELMLFLSYIKMTKSLDTLHNSDLRTLKLNDQIDNSEMSLGNAVLCVPKLTPFKGLSRK